MLAEYAVKKVKKISPVLQFIVYMVMSFIIAGTDFISLRSPLNIAIACVVSPMASTAVLAGSTVSYLVSSQLYQSLTVVSALITVVVFKWFSSINKPMQNASLSVVSFLASSVIDFFIYGFSVNLLFTYLYASIFIGGVSYFLTVLIHSDKGILSELYENKFTAVAVCFLVVTIGSSFSTGVVNAGIIISTAVTLICARCFKYSCGAAAGAAASFALILYSAGADTSSVFFAFSGMIAGAFGKYKRSVGASVFLIVNVVCGIITGITQNEIRMYIDIVLGAIIFCFVPVESIHVKKRSTDCGSDIIKSISFRMKLIAISLDEAGSKLQNPDKILSGKNAENNKIKNVYNAVCEQCSNKNYCWVSRRDMIYDAFIKAGKKRDISVSNLPSELDYCFKRNNIADEFRNNINNQIVDITANGYLKKASQILSEQLHVSADIIKSLSSDIPLKFTPDERLTERMQKCLTENDIGFSSVVAYYNSGRRLFAEIYCNKNACISGYQIYRVLTEEYEKTFECTKYYDGDEMRFFISERPPYNIESYIMQKSASEGEPNGDTCDCFKDDYGNVYLIISDGMGTGKKAAMYSETVTGIFKNLILGGIDITSSIRIINSIMLAGNKDDGFATVDIAKFDLDSGNMTMYKAGAAPTVFKHNSSVFRINADSYPIGIMNDTNLYSRRFPLKVNDTIVMLSDGVSEDVYNLIKEEILKNSADVSDISSKICKAASENAKDDISVVSAKLIRQ